MRCRKCPQKAAIHMPHHHLPLCREHYLEWFIEQTDRCMHKYGMLTHQERILVAVSGGKDSLSLWDVLWRLDYPADGLFIGLGVDEGTGYSARSLELTRRFAEERGLRLRVVDFPQVYGKTIPELAHHTRRGQVRPCSVCGIGKRHIFNQAALEGGYDILATGHNLDDEAAVLFSNLLNWDIDQLDRQSPVLLSRDGLVGKIKPFCRFYERETAAYALLRGIEYIEDECPFAVGNHTNTNKVLLNQLEAQQPGAKLNFYLGFLQVKKGGWLAAAQQKQAHADLHPCPTCGQPTTNPGDCAFCRLIGN